MIKENLLKNIPIPDNNIFRIKGENQPESEAKEYEKTIRKNIHALNGIPVFDYIMLGLGDDGHTVSIFPDQLDLFDSGKLTVVAINPYSGQKRISITGQLINNARNVAFLITGKAKAEMVKTILEKKNGWQNLPASKVQPTFGELLFLLDKEAAASLNPGY
jgi:6-phosphogluconolactonase